MRWPRAACQHRVAADLDAQRIVLRGGLAAWPGFEARLRAETWRLLARMLLAMRLPPLIRPWRPMRWRAGMSAVPATPPEREA